MYKKRNKRFHNKKTDITYNFKYYNIKEKIQKKNKKEEEIIFWYKRNF